MMSAPNTRLPRAAREKSQKSNGDSSKVADTPSKIQPTAEQIRLAQMINDTKDTDDPDLQNKIKQVMELTGKSSDDASVALHDCDNDPNRAINMLLEGDAHQGEWETSFKRKKSRPTTLPTNAEAPSGGSSNNKENRGRLERGKEREGKDRDGNRNRGPPRMNRGKGRDTEKNERNLEDSRSRERSTDRRGRGSRIINGPGRLGRGRGGGRIRMFQNRGASHSDFPRSIDTWTNVPPENADGGDPPMSVGNWSDGFPTAEDWDNEDWTGSLAETKVFTPSTAAVNSDFNSANLTLQTPVSHQSFVDASTALPPLPSPPRESVSLSSSLPSVRQVQSVSAVTFGQNNGSSDLLPHTTSVVSSSPTLSKATAFSLTSSPTTDTSLTSASLLTGSSNIGVIQVTPKITGIPPSNSLAAALGTASRNLSSAIPTSSNQQQPLPARSKSQKPRTLTTSKIPSSAVEMPEDAIAALDVQFGSLEFGSESSTLNFNSLLESAASIQTSVTSASAISNHISSIVGSQAPPSSLSSSVLQMSGASLTKTSELGSVDQSARTSYPVSTSSMAISKDLGQMGSTSQTSVPQMSASDYVSSASATDRKTAVPFSVQRTVPSSVLDGPLTGSKPNDSSLSTYSVQNNGVNNHSNFQSTYGSHKAAASFSHHHSTLSAPVTQSQSVSLYGSSVSSQSQTSVTYPTVAPSSVYGTSQSQSSFSSQNQSSVYANPVATVSTYASGSSISQTGYGSHSHSSLHSSTVASSKLTSSLGTVKDTLEATNTQHAYDASHTTTAPCLTSTLTTASSGSSSSLGLSGGVLTSSNVTTAKSSISNSKTGIPSLPPSVPAVLSHQYIMSQAGLPFYCAQQPMYTYEDLQLLQQRMPPMASYYDMAFQPSTTLTGRDGGLANVAYTGADGKFSRGDNSSPVPTTLSQQQSSTQQHQQTFISPTIPHGYSYYYPGGVVASGFTQYGAPIFNVPPATNAHGATTSTHFPKPNAYGSHAYTSGYESLGQNQDYGKTSYGSSSQNQAKAGTGSANSVSGNDLASSVYSKTHSQMNKQSYDKPGFHAGTPPPFNLAATQTGQLGAPSTAYAAAPFIPMMAQHPTPMLHHQLHQDSSSTSQRPTPTQSQSKTTSTIKQGYSSNNYWASA